MVFQQGWWALARHCHSPNFNQRPLVDDISLLVIHNISLPPSQFYGDCVERFFCNQLDSNEHPFFQDIKKLQVSSHFFIRRDGEVVQFVGCNDRAWHAGVSTFAARENCNDFAIGIELEGTDTTPYTDSQYQVLLELTQALQTEYPLITPERIVGHSDIAPGRKTDPGPAFDWARFTAGLSADSNA